MNSPSYRKKFHLRGRPRGSEAGMALVIVLTILVMVTALVVALLTLAGGERSSAGLSLQRAQAEVLADGAADIAMGKITSAIALGTQPGTSWASEPGRIWVFTIAPGSGAISRTSYDLLSALPAADPNNVDLNTPSLAGNFPIAPPASGQVAATMKVGWQNILRDPSQPATATNQIIGRVAYWVDDESCKVNINTADGSRKGNDGTYGGFPTATSATGYSFGFGTPSEISLAALTGLDQTKAGAIADTAWTQEFNSPDEITRAKDSSGNQVVTRAMYEALRFDITHYNSSPDLNFMGEPRIALMQTGTSGATTIRQNFNLGPYVNSQANGGPGAIYGLNLDQLYPQPSQLASTLPAPTAPSTRMFLHTAPRGSGFGQQLVSGTDDYYVGRLITNFLSGTNLEGQSFSWPKFDGADSSGFAGKYTLRQLDSITIQILDIASRVPYCDQFRVDCLPGMIGVGWLSGKTVMGIGREPQLNEILFTASATVGDTMGYGAKIGNPNYSYPLLRMTWVPEYYFPAGAAGTPDSSPYAGNGYAYYGSTNATPNFVNYLDYPTFSGTSSPPVGRPTGPGLVGGSTWQDVLLTALDQDGNPAGVNFAGCSSLWDDADQAKAAQYHPYCVEFTGTSAPWIPKSPAVYSGDVFQAAGQTPRAWGMLEILGPIDGSNTIAPGCAIDLKNRYGTSDHGAKPGTTSIRLKGGLQIWVRNGTNVAGYIIPMLAPFESIVPTLTATAFPADITDKVLPVDFTVSVPGTKQYLLRAFDPLVNQYPGDWEAITNPTAADITEATPNAAGNGTVTPAINGGAAALDPYFSLNTTVPVNFNCDNTGFRPTGGGDPLSVWLPRQDPRIPKQARFPSVGGLFSIRTGLFPDKDVEGLPFQQQHGTPFRGLNMAPSTQASQKTSGGTSYPDWAILDLFHVPFLPQKPYAASGQAISGLSSTVQSYRRLTYGGATVGRININNPPVPYPFAQDPSINTSPPQRNALQALFYGLKPSKAYNAPVGTATGTPIYTTLSGSDASTLAGAIAAYQAANGPFFMAGQVANVPGVANYLYTFGAQASGPTRTASISRNDLVRDIVGAITTRSNVYSVWVVAQTIKKSRANSNYGVFETGDKVTAEVRRHYLVERFLDTGADGVPGNAVAPSTPNIPNTYTVAKPNGDDVTPAAPIYQPSMTYPLPYRWRVVGVENIQM